MTKEIKIYDTWEIAKKDIKLKKNFRPLHHDLINNKWMITFVNGIDDPNKTPEMEAQREEQKLKQERKKALNKKLETIDLTNKELNELARLERGL